MTELSRLDMDRGRRIFFDLNARKGGGGVEDEKSTMWLGRGGERGEMQEDEYVVRGGVWKEKKGPVTITAGRTKWLNE